MMVEEYHITNKKKKKKKRMIERDRENREIFTWKDDACIRKKKRGC